MHGFQRQCGVLSKIMHRLNIRHSKMDYRTCAQCSVRYAMYAVQCLMNGDRMWPAAAAYLSEDDDKC